MSQPKHLNLRVAGGIALILTLCLGGVPAGAGASSTSTRSEAPLVRVLMSGPEPSYKEALRGFQGRLGERLGPDGERYRLTVGFLTEDHPDDIKMAGVDGANLIVSLGAPATRLARRAADGRPVVFSMVVDPAAEGLYEEGKLFHGTGVTTEIPLEDQLHVLARVIPGAKRVGVLHHALDTPLLESIRGRAAELGLELVSVPVQSNEQVLPALEQLTVKIDVLWTFGRLLRDATSLAQFLILHSLRNQLPFMASSPSQVERGALFCAYASPEDIGRQAADVVTDLLSGRNVAELPPQTPKVARIALNLKAADAIGLAIPREVRKTAAPVY